MRVLQRSIPLMGLLPLVAAATALEASAPVELVSDDECATAAGDNGKAGCALNALQHRGALQAATASAQAGAASTNQSKAHTWSRGPPKNGMGYNGIAWDEITVSNPEPETHVFAIGDWGGMDGSFVPEEGHPQIVVYPGGASPGPHVFPRSRMQCGHKDLVSCYWPGRECKSECGFLPSVDSNPQLLVANVFKARAAKNNPEYILNVGDNFYFGGIETTCGKPMGTIHPTTRHQFDTVFEGVYNGAGLSGKKWISVLGNHDWGGFHFDNGWDQQIAYTWASSRWVMPGAYYSLKANYPGFSIDYYMLDSNFVDAMDPPQDPEHNICSELHNNPGANCSGAGGPGSVEGCKAWFQSFWQQQKLWLERKLAQSKADWQIIVTHFPCGFEAGWFSGLNARLGLDLLVTGHRHDQELWKAGEVGYAGILGGLTCFVTGGGGGITSEESLIPGTPTHNWPNVNTQYGFFDLTISKSKILVESISYEGEVIDSTVVHPSR